MQDLPAELFKFWINTLCVARKNDGVLPDAKDIAFRLRLPEAETENAVQDLVERGLVDKTERGLMPHNWEERQRPSDVSAPRVRRYRMKQDGNVTGNVTVTTQSRGEEIRKEEKRKASPYVQSAGRVYKPPTKTSTESKPNYWKPDYKDESKPMQSVGRIYDPTKPGGGL